MADKLNIAREYIIGQLETGNLSGGDKLPGARELSEQIGVSHAITQMAFVSLVRDGVLESFPRSGTFVRGDWRERILPDSFVSFRSVWSDVVRSRFPGLQVHDCFRKGVFEIRTTLEVLHRRDEYLNLAELFREAYPDDAPFFSAPFRSFRTADGGLFGIPLIFSPRVLCYNAGMLAGAGCPEPRSGWGWDEFIEDIRRLRRLHPPERIFNWSFLPFWMNFIFRAGGGIIGTAGVSEVMLDSPRTRDGIMKVRELYRALGVTEKWPALNPYEAHFSNGECAFMLAARQEVNFNAPHCWKSVPLPLIPGGADLTAQATDLLCVRRYGGDLPLARELIRLMLSEEVQDHIGQLRYGIPIRKSSAMRSFDPEDSRDALFLSEMTKISADYNLDSPELTRMINHGLNEIWLNGADVDETTAELAAALRTVLRYRNFELKGTRS
ncbi:MAG: extracellular solute-binding protein [Lentisphaeria bacterium]|nr:extracellular solute-binding protein [Lentisphaeria bacterium]